MTYIYLDTETTGYSGSFSNTVTTSSDLAYIIVIFEKSKLMNLGLLEYSKYPVKNYKYEYVEMNIKSDNGEIHTIKIVFGTNSFIIDDEGYNIFLNLIKNNNKLKVYINVENSKYNFEVNCIGFTKQYNSLINQ